MQINKNSKRSSKASSDDGRRKKNSYTDDDDESVTSEKKHLLKTYWNLYFNVKVKSTKTHGSFYIFHCCH